MYATHSIFWASSFISHHQRMSSHSSNVFLRENMFLLTLLLPLSPSLPVGVLLPGKPHPASTGSGSLDGASFEFNAPKSSPSSPQLVAPVHDIPRIELAEGRFLDFFEILLSGSTFNRRFDSEEYLRTAQFGQARHGSCSSSTFDFDFE